MREAHIGRRDSVSEKSVAEELKQNLEEVMNFNGSRVEKLLMTFCIQTKIKYNKLSEEEKQNIYKQKDNNKLGGFIWNDRNRKAKYCHSEPY